MTKQAATYEQMIAALADWYEMGKKYDGETNTANGYAHAIADAFGMDVRDVRKDMREHIAAQNA